MNKSPTVLLISEDNILVRKFEGEVPNVFVQESLQPSQVLQYDLVIVDSRNQHSLEVQCLPVPVLILVEQLPAPNNAHEQVRYFTEPFSEIELQARIRLLLGEARNRVGVMTPAEPNEVILFRKQKILRGKFRWVRIGKHGCRLAELLLGDIDTTVSVSDIGQYLPCESEIAIRMIVSRLRKHLDSIGAPIAIETVRGLGYRARWESSGVRFRVLTGV